MKKYFKFSLVLVLSVSSISALLSACASVSQCNNDACYDRRVSSVDPYKKGEVAAWGTEKEQAEQDALKEQKALKEFSTRKP